MWTNVSQGSITSWCAGMIWAWSSSYGYLQHLLSPSASVILTAPRGNVPRTLSAAMRLELEFIAISFTCVWFACLYKNTLNKPFCILIGVHDEALLHPSSPLPVHVCDLWKPEGGVSDSWLPSLFGVQDFWARRLCGPPAMTHPCAFQVWNVCANTCHSKVCLLIYLLTWLGDKSHH